MNPDSLKATITEFHGKEKHNYFDHEVSDRVPLMLCILAIIYLIVGWIGCLLIKYHKIEPAENDPLEKKVYPTTEKILKKSNGFLKTKEFWILYFFNMFAGFPVSYIIFCFK